jgi:3-oxoisoapionate decarboxylase
MHIGLSVYGTTFGMGIDPHAGRPTITPSQLMDKAISVGLEGVELPCAGYLGHLCQNRHL